MFGQNVTLFTIFGFRVRANMSWVLLFALVLWSLSAGFFPIEYPNMQGGIYWAMGFLGTIGLFFSLLFHELAHSLVARARGMRMGGITLFLFGGMAEMTDEPPTPRIEGEVAAAGPISSFILGGAFYLLGGLLAALGVPEHWAGVVGYLALINVVLAVFNLVPGFPLDGGRLLRALLWYLRDDLLSATKTAARVGQGFGILLIVLGVWSFLTAAAVGGIWWILIGLFVHAAAKASYQQTLMRHTFEGARIDRFVVPDPVSVPPDLPLDRFVEDYAYRYHFSFFPVTEGDRLVGCVRTRDVKTIRPEEWPTTAVAEIMQSCQGSNTIAPDADAEKVLEKMQQNESGQLIVAENGRLAGLVTLRDLLSHLSIRQELETRE